MAARTASRRLSRDFLALGSFVAWAICAQAQETPSEVFDERGYTDVGQALQDVPAFGVPPVNATNQQSAFGIAQSLADYRF
jgi:hypothetical protein